MRLRHMLAVVFVVVASSSLALAADTYKVDPVHSTVIFKVGHFEVSNFQGRFNEPTGTVAIDPGDPSKSSFNIEIQADKVDTANAKRDGHLKSPDFFDVKQFPTITFKSTAVKGSGDKLEVIGDLTLHGVTKSITVPVTRVGEKDTGKMGYRTGWEATFNLKRSDYGMTTMVGPVADEVQLTVSLEAVKG